MKTAIVLVCVFVCVCCHDYYRVRIPNGLSVPNPCQPGGIWNAVGHYNPLHHTVEKNPFALAFAANGHVWSEALCKLDSDGDGVTNGDELGDLTCTWVQNGPAPDGSATGQPGICEPVDSATCAHQAFSCGCHGHNCVVGK